jgi:hypothetical protein
MKDNYIIHMESINTIKFVNPDKLDLRLPPPDIENYGIKKITDTNR